MISDRYRALNERMHVEQPLYGCSGSRWSDTVLELVRRLDADDVLDYGCGKQTLAAMVSHAVSCRGYDPAIAHLAARPDPADLVVCTDVMEHVEREYVGAVLDDVAGLARKAAFFAISCEQGTRRLPDGRHAHVTVKDPDWWMRRLSKRFGAIERVEPRAKAVELVVIAHTRITLESENG